MISLFRHLGNHPVLRISIFCVMLFSGISKASCTPVYWVADSNERSNVHVNTYDLIGPNGYSEPKVTYDLSYLVLAYDPTSLQLELWGHTGDIRGHGCSFAADSGRFCPQFFNDGFGFHSWRLGPHSFPWIVDGDEIDEGVDILAGTFKMKSFDGSYWWGELFDYNPNHLVTVGRNFSVFNGGISENGHSAGAFGFYNCQSELDFHHYSNAPCYLNEVIFSSFGVMRYVGENRPQEIPQPIPEPSSVMLICSGLLLARRFSKGHRAKEEA